VLVVHPEMMVAEAISSALASFPAIRPLPPATSAAEAEARVARSGPVDAVAVQEHLTSGGRLVDRLRHRGARVVTFGRSSGNEDEGVRVPTEEPIAALAAALVPSLPLRRRSRLSVQQRRVLSLVARGLTAKEIARDLGISPKTVEQHKARICERLGVRNQAEAVRVEYAEVTDPWSAA
jgi:DNA-binding CsgD family transcriptional regulator